MGLDSEKTNHGKSLQVLVIADAFPKPSDGARSLRLTRILRCLREKGHEVTLVMREDVNQSHYDLLLEELGIRTFAGDKERLVPLAVEATSDHSWMLRDVFLGRNFDATNPIAPANRCLSRLNAG